MYLNTLKNDIWIGCAGGCAFFILCCSAQFFNEFIIRLIKWRTMVAADKFDFSIKRKFIEFYVNWATHYSSFRRRGQHCQWTGRRRRRFVYLRVPLFFVCFQLMKTYMPDTHMYSYSTSAVLFLIWFVQLAANEIIMENTWKHYLNFICAHKKRHRNIEPPKILTVRLCGQCRAEGSLLRANIFLLIFNKTKEKFHIWFYDWQTVLR